jgi:cytochrome P450
MIAPELDDMFAPSAIADPYAYYARLRELDPVHWNERYQLWVITRYDDIVWMIRHHELFSSAVIRNDPRPPYPPVDPTDLGLVDYVRQFRANQLVEHDRPEHLAMRQVVHGYFTPGAWSRGACSCARGWRSSWTRRRRGDGWTC